MITAHAIAAYVVGNSLVALFLGVWIWEPLRVALREWRTPRIWRRVLMWLAVNAAILAIAWRVMSS